MRMPAVLDGQDDAAAVEVLQTYYGLGGRRAHGYTGARYDTWDSTGTRWADADRFTADDLVAVTFLSVQVPPVAAVLLLDQDADRFADLLARLGPDEDLADVEQPLPDGWVGWQLWKALVDLPGVGPTIASKLLAHKRPRLRPIYDSVVVEVTGNDQQWRPLRDALRADNRALHERLLRIRDAAGLGEHAQPISALRVFDVLTWMQGKQARLDAGLH